MTVIQIKKQTRRGLAAFASRNLETILLVAILDLSGHSFGRPLLRSRLPTLNRIVHATRDS